MYHRERGRAGRADAGRRAGHRQDGALGGRRRGRPGARLPRARAPQRRGRGGLRVRGAVGSRCAGLRRDRRRAARRLGARRWRWRCCSQTRATRPAEPGAVGLALLDVLRLLARERPCSSRWTTCSGLTRRPLRCCRPRCAGSRRARRSARDGARDAGPAAWDPTRAAGAVARATGDRRRHELLRERLGLELARPQLARLHEVSGGNPFFALELARAPDGRVPESLRDLLGGRIAALPPETADVLLLAAALARPTEDWSAPHTTTRTRRAMALEAAGDVLVNNDGRLRFTHPLLASLCYDRAAPSRRRDAHRRLAVVVDDVEERARHLALAVTRARRGGRRRSSTPPRPMPRRAAQRSPRPSWPISRPSARRQSSRDPATSTADAPATAVARRAICGRATAIHDELLAATTAGPRARRPAVRRWPLSGGRTHVAERASCASRAIAEAGPDDARAIELSRQARHLPLARRNTGIGLAARPRWAGDGPSASATLGCSSSPRGVVAYLETSRADRSRPACSSEAARGERRRSTCRCRSTRASRVHSSLCESLAQRRPGGGTGDPRETTSQTLRRRALTTRTSFALHRMLVARGVAARALGRRSRPRTRGCASSRTRPTTRTTGRSADYFSALTEADRGQPRRGAGLRGERPAGSRSAVGDEIYDRRQRGTMLGHIELLIGSATAARPPAAPAPGASPEQRPSAMGVAYMTWVGHDRGAHRGRRARRGGVAPGRSTRTSRRSPAARIGRRRSRVRGLVAAARGDTEARLASLAEAAATRGGADDSPSSARARCSTSDRCSVERLGAATGCASRRSRRRSRPSRNWAPRLGRSGPATSLGG